MRSRISLALATTTLALAGTAAAGPRVTETADALPLRDCELELDFARLSTSGLPAIRGWDSILGCGVGAGTQLGLGYARARADGFSASSVGMLGKTNFVEPGPQATGWALAYSLAAVKEPGASMKLEESSLAVVATRTLASGWLGHANLGWDHTRSAKKNSTGWSVGVESTADLALAADFFGDDRDKPWASAGVGYSFGRGLSASVRYALQFEKPRVKELTLGAKLAF